MEEKRKRGRPKGTFKTHFKRQVAFRWTAEDRERAIEGLKNNIIETGSILDEQGKVKTTTWYLREILTGKICVCQACKEKNHLQAEENSCR